jgi:hypothetical protein
LTTQTLLIENGALAALCLHPIFIFIPNLPAMLKMVRDTAIDRSRTLKEKKGNG